MSAQTPDAVVLVRPHRFSPDPSECADNAFMTPPQAPADDVARAAHDEVSRLAEGLDDAGVTVHLFDDLGTHTPDSVFPNNWFSTHHDGSLVLYPMRSQTRRRERRADIVDTVHDRYAVARVHDYSPWELQGHFLEGTGSMVLDHEAKVAYVCRSHRVSDVVLARFCADLGFTGLTFNAVDARGTAIYHTNVMMSIGERLALLCEDSLRDPAERSAVRASLEAAGREVLPLTLAQVGEFAGNALEVRARDGGLLVMSERGWRSLRPAQRRVVERSVGVLPARIPTIEHAGGSARCMLAGIHAPARANGAWSQRSATA